MHTTGNTNQYLLDWINQLSEDCLSCKKNPKNINTQHKVLTVVKPLTSSMVLYQRISNSHSRTPALCRTPKIFINFVCPTTCSLNKTLNHAQKMQHLLVSEFGGHIKESSFQHAHTWSHIGCVKVFQFNLSHLRAWGKNWSKEHKKIPQYYYLQVLCIQEFNRFLPFLDIA